MHLIAKRELHLMHFRGQFFVFFSFFLVHTPHLTLSTLPLGRIVAVKLLGYILETCYFAHKTQPGVAYCPVSMFHQKKAAIFLDLAVALADLLRRKVLFG